MTAKVLTSAFCVVALFVSATGAQSSAKSEIYPREQVVLPGDPVKLMCRTGTSIYYCRMEPPHGTALQLRPGTNNVAKSGDSSYASYYGEGFDKGQCGMMLQRASERDNGVWKCTMGTETSTTELAQSATITVAREPMQPRLIVMPSESTTGDGNRYELVAGRTVHASCSIPNGRPPANITWFIGEQPVTEGLTRPEVTNGSMNDTQTVSQNLTREVSWQDNGKYLRCVSQHLALTNPALNESRFMLNVTYPPQPLSSSQTEQFGFEVGKEGIIRVEIQANPVPKLVWEIDGQQIQEGSTDHENHYQAGPPRNLGEGRWEATLRITRVEEADIQKQFKLRATNYYGLETYQIALSTSSEPTVMELGAGSIIGIVVAILFVLLVIFLVIFARATGRWCFAAGGPKGAAGSHTDSEAHIDPEGQHKEGAGVGTGADNPSANHNASSEYINGNKKEPIKDDKDTPV